MLVRVKLFHKGHALRLKIVSVLLQGSWGRRSSALNVSWRNHQPLKVSGFKHIGWPLRNALIWSRERDTPPLFILHGKPSLGNLWPMTKHGSTLNFRGCCFNVRILSVNCKLHHDWLSRWLPRGWQHPHWLLHCVDFVARHGGDTACQSWWSLWETRLCSRASTCARKILTFVLFATSGPKWSASAPLQITFLLHFLHDDTSYTVQ